VRRIAAVGLVAIVLAILAIFGVSPPMHYMEGRARAA
jgi:hypothetical protein